MATERGATYALRTTASFWHTVRLSYKSFHARGRRSETTKMAGRSKKKAETVFLVCEETGDYNYAIRRKPGGEKLRLKKYSPKLRKHTWHAEKKK
jgi:large subunit ribosomal protein L33